MAIEISGIVGVIDTEEDVIVTDNDVKATSIKCRSLRTSGMFNVEVEKFIKADGYIEAGGSIYAGWYIKADGYIKAGGSIYADGSIEADGYIEAGGYIKAGWSIYAGGSIKADGSIKAGWSIYAGGSIKAGWYIKAGGSIEVGGYIEAGEFFYNYTVSVLPEQYKVGAIRFTSNDYQERGFWLAIVGPYASERLLASMKEDCWQRIFRVAKDEMDIILAAPIPEAVKQAIRVNMKFFCR